MKKFFILTALLTLLSAAAQAGYYDNAKYLEKESIKPFARDLGGLLGSGAAQTARSLGFSGFDIGVRAAAQVQPSKANTVLENNRTFGLGFVQIELGMPFRVDGFIRGNVYEGISIVGGGLRYGLWNVSDEPYKLNASIIGMPPRYSGRFCPAGRNRTEVLFRNSPPRVRPALLTKAKTALHGKVCVRRPLPHLKQCW